MLTRERILQFLRMYRQASAAEMADAMGMTQANLRYHLAALKEAGAVEVVAAGEGGGRGRPAQMYRLAVSGRPDNFSVLAGALLSAHFSSGNTPANTEARLHELANEMVGEPARMPGVLTQRLGRAVQWLDAHGYDSAWEARPLGPVLRLRNCPYASQVGGHPELCRMDALVVEKLTDMLARQTAWIDMAGGSSPACVFALRTRTGTASGLSAAEPEHGWELG